MASDQDFNGWLPRERIHPGPNSHVFRVSRGEDNAVLKVCTSWRQDKAAYRRFSREIETMRELAEDPGVMPLIEAEIPDPPAKGRRPWYVMPEGVAFTEAFDGDPFAVVTAVASIAATLSRLHQHDFHHRDVKPANLFVLGPDRYVVGDLGLVGRPPGQQPGITESGEKLGPANFIAPEMLQVDPEQVDARFADVYSLAKVLWVLIARRDYPLPGPQRVADPTSLAAQSGDGRLTEIDGLIERATTNEPEARPAINEVASELDFWLERHGKKDAEAADLEDIVNAARARLASHHDQKLSSEREIDAAEEAFGSLLDELDPLYRAIEQIGPTSDLNAYGQEVESALAWADGETIGGPQILKRLQNLAFAQVAEEPNAIRLHLAVRLLLYEDGSVSLGVGLDVTSFPMALGSSRFHWREIEEDIPVNSIRLQHEINRLAAAALEKSGEAIDVFSRMGQELG